MLNQEKSEGGININVLNKIEVLSPVRKMSENSIFLERQKPTSRSNIRAFVAECSRTYYFQPPFVDVACGYRTNEPEVISSTNNKRPYIAFDCTSTFDKEIVKSASLNTLADAKKIPLLDESTNTVVCTGALEHIDNDILALKEIFRIMKSGGYFVLTVPGIDISKHEKFYQRDYRRYIPNELFSTLENLGFSVLKTQEKFFEDRQINILALSIKKD